MSPRQWLDDLIRQHDDRVARRGREYIGRVRGLRFEPRSGAVTCEVPGSGEEPYVVTLRPPIDVERHARSVNRRAAEQSETRNPKSAILNPSPAPTDALDASCSCPYGEAGRFLCKHTFAAAARLAELWDARPEADLAELLSGESSGSAWSARPLQLLDAFLHEAEPGEAAPEPTARLCWLVKPHRGGPFGAGLSVRAVAETWLGGRWRRSEPLPWDRLVESFDSAELVATPQDREAVLAVRRDEQSYGFHAGRKLWTVDAFALVAALVGHPRVFLAGRDGGPLEVTSGTLGLAIVVRDDGFGVVPAVDGAAVELASHHASEKADTGPTTFFPGLSGVIALDRDHGRLTVAEAEPKARRLVASLRPEETVPFLEIEELVGRLVRIESLLPVAWPGELRGGHSEADGRVHVQLERLEPFGLSIRPVVQPAEAGETFPPGSGPAVVAACERGRRTERVRDLDEERRTADEVVARLGLARHARPKRWRWVVEDADDALVVIERLGNLEPDRAVAEWPAGEPVRLVGTLSTKSLRVRIGEARDWFRLDGGATLDGRTVPLAELLVAAVEGREFIRLNDDAWAKVADDLREHVARLASVLPSLPQTNPTTQALPSGVRIPRSVAPAVAECLNESGCDLEASPAWRDATAAMVGPAIHDLPAGFRATLRPYQLEGYRWLAVRSDADLGCCLADDMGLGKTIQTLAALLRRADRGPALVTMPTSVEPNWLDEATRFAPSLRTHRLRELTGDQLAALGPGDVVLASHALLRLRAEDLAAVRWATLVIDEAHAVKNPETRLAEAARRLRPAWTLALTGTPVENHPGELWAIFHLLAPDLLGPWTRFRKRFAEPIAGGDYHARDALRRLVGPYLLRRTKEEVLPDLPPRLETTRFIEPTEEQRALYDRVRTAALAELESCDPNRRRLLAALTRLRQIAAHPALVDPRWPEASPKLDAILNVLDELRSEGRRPLVFSPFAKHLRLIAAALETRGLRPLLLTGLTPEADRAGIVAAFQRGEGDAFLISLKAGGTGLNLTAADTVLIADPWWNPAAEAQAAGRAHRIGQDRTVTVVRFLVRGTIEEEMLRLQEAKRDLADGLLGGAAPPTEVELRALLSPRTPGP